MKITSSYESNEEKWCLGSIAKTYCEENNMSFATFFNNKFYCYTEKNRTHKELNPRYYFLEEEKNYCKLKSKCVVCECES